MTKLSVKTVDVDKNQESLFFVKQICTNGPPIATPIMAYNNGLIRRNEQVAPATRGLNEIYCEIPTQKTTLTEFYKNPEATAILDQRIKSQIRKTSDNELNMCIVESSIEKYPIKAEWEFLLDTTHANSDIVPIPNTPIITDDIIDSESKFSDYLSFLTQSIEYLRLIN